jgi:hypothetical protein
MSTPRPSTGGLPRRRNGKQQACEPCRKAKMACDHTLPVCDRCKRRKVVARCIYLSAPMTRPSVTGSLPRTAQELSEEENRVLPHKLTPASTISSTPFTSSPSPQLASPTSNNRHSASVTRTPSSNDIPQSKSAGGFFGPTSFSAVFLENKHSFGADNADINITNDTAELHPLQSLESLQSQTFLMLAGSLDHGCNPRIALGAKLLKAFPDRHTFNFLLEWFYEKVHEQSIIKHAVMSCAESIWSTYGSFLKEPRSKEGMERFSKILCENSQKVLQEPSGDQDYAKWLESFSGDNLRWEILGLVYSALTSATLSLPERDAFFCTQKGSRRDRKVFAVEMKDCVQACVTLSNYMDLINFPMVALLAKNLVLQTVISGDTSKS